LLGFGIVKLGYSVSRLANLDGFTKGDGRLGGRLNWLFACFMSSTFCKILLVAFSLQSCRCMTFGGGPGLGHALAPYFSPSRRMGHDFTRPGRHQQAGMLGTILNSCIVSDHEHCRTWV
jgi:hypothetical protein